MVRFFLLLLNTQNLNPFLVLPTIAWLDSVDVKHPEP